jgi:ATP-dependent DNA ligase
MPTATTPFESTALSNFNALVLDGKLSQDCENGKGKYPTGDGFRMEPKMDGWRILCHVHESGVSFYSRSGKSYNDKLPKVEAELLAHFPAGTWLDGEVVALRLEDGKVYNDWGVAQSVLTKLGGNAAADKVSYMIFDLLAHRGIDARPLPYANRRKLLEQIFDGEDFDKVALTPTFDSTEANYAAFVEAGYEGAVVKREDAPYRSNKREGAGWTKVKPVHSLDAVVMDWQPGESGFKGLVGAVIFGQHDADGKLVEVGRCSGMDMRTRLDMTHHWDKWEGKVIEVAYQERMPSGALRFPQFKRLRSDRSAESVLIHD